MVPIIEYYRVLSKETRQKKKTSKFTVLGGKSSNPPLPPLITALFGDTFLPKFFTQNFLPKKATLLKVGWFEKVTFHSYLSFSLIDWTSFYIEDILP